MPSQRKTMTGLASAAALLLGAGGLVAYVGSGGFVEVAVRDGSAMRRTGLGVGGKVKARLG